MYSSIVNYSSKNYCSSPLLTSEGAYNLVDYILLSIRKFGKKVAQVESENNNYITYEEIIGRVSSLGFFFESEGIKHQEVVAVLSRNSVNFCWIVLGTLHTGAICALFSPDATTRELENFVKITKPKYVIGPHLDKNQLEVFINDGNVKLIFTEERSLESKKLRLFRELYTLSNHKGGLLRCKADLYDAAFILSSSGSTGTPKGVLLHHNNIISALCHSKLFVKSNGIGLGLMPFFHAYGLGLMLMALCEGSKLITMSKFAMDFFLHTIQDHKISHLYLVPSLVVSLAKQPSVTKKMLSSVKEMFTGAGPITTNQQQAILKKLSSSAKLYHSYGMTETTFVVLFGEYKPDKPSSAGKLIPGMKSMIVNENGEEIGIGKTGELLLKGSLVMEGYYENELATKETIDDNRWLHTGDLVFKDPDGFYYVIERIKELIKYQGYQVSPTEIELVLCQHKGIMEVAVVGIPHELYGEVPKAYVVKNDDHVLTKEDVKSLLIDELSPYKQLKGGVEFVKFLPKSPSGKVLKKVLKQND